MEEIKKKLSELSNKSDYGLESDPSSLTMQLVLREVASLERFILAHIDRIDKAVIVAHNDFVRFPTEVQKEVGNLELLHQEKFNSINQRFTDAADLRNEKLSGIQKQIDMQDKLVGIQYNFLVESITKSDSAFIKLNEQMSILIIANKNSTDDKINNVKDSVNEIKSMVTGLLSSGTGKQEQTKNIWAIVAGGIAIIAFLIGLASFIMKIK